MNCTDRSEANMSLSCCVEHDRPSACNRFSRHFARLLLQRSGVRWKRSECGRCSNKLWVVGVLRCCRRSRCCGLVALYCTLAQLRVECVDQARVVQRRLTGSAASAGVCLLACRAGAQRTQNNRCETADAEQRGNASVQCIGDKQFGSSKHQARR